MTKCKNCGKEFTQKTHDIFGRVISRKSPFCSMKCRSKYFRKENPSYHKEYYRKRFKKNLDFDKDLTACEQAGIVDMVAEEEFFSIYDKTNLDQAVSDYIDRHNTRDLFDRAKSYIKDAEITEKVLNMKD